MSKRLSAGEKAARAFLKDWERWWARNPSHPEKMIINRSGYATEQRPEIQWLLKKGWMKRERTASPSGMCRARRITFMVLTALGRRSLKERQ